MTDADRGEVGEERVDDFLVLALLYLPFIAVWFLLRPCYSKEIRIGAMIYAAAVAVALILSVRRMAGF